ncbi:uncharacterized protein LOC141601754 [Silene latifolia]|uniref:uncharacterized protein LOC141601754 n=1 Tax=Silene latifolia TaxID=37657 RepID=UPI003D782FA4
MNQFPEASIIFHPEGLYDHCPYTISLWPVTERRKGSFRFFNMWGQDDAFLPIVQSVWDEQIEWYTMFQIVKKLKALKTPLKALNDSSFANIETAAKVALIYLHETQKLLHAEPTNEVLHANEKLAATAFRELDSARRSFLSQKAKAYGMSDGDENSQYFHSIMKARRLQNRILCIQDRHGVTHTNLSNIEGAFEDYYQQLLGTSKPVGNVHFPL